MNNDSDKKGISISINIIGSIIAITAIIITLLTLFDVFSDKGSNQDDEKICPPNNCYITANNVSTTFLSCPSVTTSELFNTQLITVTDGPAYISNLTFCENVDINEINENVKFMNGIKTNLKIDNLNVSFSNLSTLNISGTNLKVKSINKQSFVNTSLIKTSDINSINSTITNMTITNPVFKNLSCTTISSTNVTFSNINLNKSNLSINNLSASSLDLYILSITNSSFTGNSLNFPINSKIVNANDIVVLNKLTIQSGTNANSILNVTNSSFTNMTLSYITSTNFNVLNVLNCSNIFGESCTMNVDKIISVPNINTQKLNFTNMTLKDSLVVSNTLSVKNLSTSQHSIKNITVENLLVSGDEAISNLSVSKMKLNHSTINLYNLTLTDELTTIYIIQNNNTLKTAINDTNTLLPYCESFFITTDISNKNLKLKIYFKADENFNKSLYIGTSFKLLISTKLLNSNIQILMANEIIQHSLFFYSTSFLFNQKSTSNLYKAFECKIPSRDTEGKYIATENFIYYYNNQLLPINDTITFFCFDYVLNSNTGNHLAYQISSSL